MDVSVIVTLMVALLTAVPATSIHETGSRADTEADDMEEYHRLLERQKQEFVDALGYGYANREDGDSHALHTDSRVRRDSGLDVYGLLAAAGGGSVLTVPKGEALNHTDFSLVTLKSPVLVTRRQFHVAGGKTVTFTFSCDSSLDILVVQVMTSCCRSRAVVIDPSGHVVTTADRNVNVTADGTKLHTLWITSPTTGHVVTTADRNVNVTADGTKLHTLWITSPTTGVWRVNVTDTAAQDYDVRIRGDSVVGFDFDQTNSRGIAVSGSPIQGSNQTYVTVTPLGGDRVSNWTSLIVMTTAGDILQTLPLGKQFGRSSHKFLVQVTWPNEDVFVAVQGLDGSGNPFTRESSIPVQPLGIRLKLQNPGKDFISSCNSPSNIPFTVKNVGKPATFTTSVLTDNNKFTATVTPTSLHLDTNGTANASASVVVTMPTTKDEAVTVTILVTAPGHESQYVHTNLIAQGQLCAPTTVTQTSGPTPTASSQTQVPTSLSHSTMTAHLSYPPSARPNLTSVQSAMTTVQPTASPTATSTVSSQVTGHTESGISSTMTSVKSTSTIVQSTMTKVKPIVTTDPAIMAMTDSATSKQSTVTYSIVPNSNVTPAAESTEASKSGKTTAAPFLLLFAAVISLTWKKQTIF